MAGISAAQEASQKNETGATSANSGQEKNGVKAADGQDTTTNGAEGLPGGAEGSSSSNEEKAPGNTVPDKQPANNGNKEHPKPDKDLCSPENWEDLFEYRISDVFTYRVVTKKIYSMGEDKGETSKGMILQKEKSTGEVTVILVSRYLRQLLRDTSASVGMEMDIGSRQIRLSPPYAAIFHFLDDMKAEHASMTDTSPLQNANFAAMCRYFEEGAPSAEFQTARQNLAEGIITYKRLWALYKPGDLACMSTLGHPEVVRIHSAVERGGLFGEPVWEITVIQISWDGRTQRFQRSKRAVQQPRFSVSRKIRSLKLVPLAYLDEVERAAMVESVTERGKKWAKLCTGKPITMSYKGSAIPYLVNPGMPWADAPRPEEEFIEGRVIVDPGAVAKAKRHANLLSRSLTDKTVAEAGQNDPLKSMFDFLGLPTAKEVEEQSEPEYIICPSTIPVFTLEEQEWMIVCVDDICEANWSADAFERLRLLRRIPSKEKRSDDIIKRKGKGLVMLFYGPPGVGKTLTAEALSEKTQLPLYRVNLGVVSSNPNWEHHLDHIFDCAYSWNAILLIGEAEVVLEERTFRGRDQNTWVSVFLRKLEYYQGILILTTNMIHTIDEAFRSRISVAYDYGELDKTSRQRVWRDFIEAIDGRKVNKRGLLAEVERWANVELNARQIRNILMTAETVTLEKISLLEADDVEDIMRDTDAFRKVFKAKEAANKRRVLG
ncbi:putative AAA family ATPase y4kL [Madurella mycetomatis]|uniref:AAA family ATPase y4kL n=1 Tax=Madurella mycetomatis TaxID=100816 RepID=A0A175W3P1_9PEZI|nr:putative AAA family ATPase y4kL [Madurella mycetomatis]